MKLKKRVTRAALLLLLVAVLTGCRPEESTVLEVRKPTPDVTPPVVETTPTPTVTNGENPPEITPTQSIEPDDIDGQAEPDDVLPPARTYSEYKQINSDVIGWLKIDNTQIDYPVVRGSDNDYYLTHNVEKKSSKHGAIFMDFRNADEDQQKHLIIYGHNMKNGTMFHGLHNYKTAKFFEDNPTIKLKLGTQEMEFEVYAAYVWQSGEAYYYHTRFGSDQNFADVMNALVDYAKKSKTSNVREGITIKSTDVVLTLSTCTYEYDNSRFVVSARRIK
ncbi:class B sortase [Eubacteriales bacterium OttesenSCG-928-K08]|nr:class B sortase [Eubacteriales bacterium OttesenSCG-928-K08]